MVDVNKEAENTLLKLPYKVCYYYPDEWNALPVISFYNISESGAFAFDNKEVIQRGTVVVDIWSDAPDQCGKINMEIAAQMVGDGWYKEMSMDVPPVDGVYHRTSRYTKIFNNY